MLRFRIFSSWTPYLHRKSHVGGPKLFLDKILKALHVFECSKTKAVKLAAYKLDDLAEQWFETLHMGRQLPYPHLLGRNFLRLL